MSTSNVTTREHEFRLNSVSRSDARWKKSVSTGSRAIKENAVHDFGSLQQIHQDDGGLAESGNILKTSFQIENGDGELAPSLQYLTRLGWGTHKEHTPEPNCANVEELIFTVTWYKALINAALMFDSFYDAFTDELHLVKAWNL